MRLLKTAQIQVLLNPPHVWSTCPTPMGQVDHTWGTWSYITHGAQPTSCVINLPVERRFKELKTSSLNVVRNVVNFFDSSSRLICQKLLLALNCENILLLIKCYTFLNHTHREDFQHNSFVQTSHVYTFKHDQKVFTCTTAPVGGQSHQRYRIMVHHSKSDFGLLPQR